MTKPLSDKQLEFIINSTAKWNLAHGAVRTGKTVGNLFRFMQAVNECPDSQIAMIGHTSTTIFQNAVRLILESPQLALFRPFCTWFPSKNELRFKDKKIATIGAKDEGSVGLIQGRTFSLVYCDEMTLYPQSVIEMINSRLSLEHSMGFASMNPSHPNHILKQWIDKAEAGDPNYYALHFEIDDNPFLPEEYVKMLKSASTGVFYKRNVLGLWCQAEGAIFDFFDEKLHVIPKPYPADYWIASIDYGTSNPFACLLIGVNTGASQQMSPRMWVEKEYYWDPVKKERQKTNAEFANDVQEFLENYGVRNIYVDPSAESFKLELRRRGMHPVNADNDVQNGIEKMLTYVQQGKVQICSGCKNLIREIGTYVWDARAAKEGEDQPKKQNDHAIDALRYAIMTHKIMQPGGGDARTLGYKDPRHPGGFRGYR